MLPPKISCVLITKNASSTLERALQSVYEWVDEIVIIDSDSIDDTRIIGKQFNAKIISISESHEGRQRMNSLRYPRNDWVLSLDSDEVVSPVLQKEIIKTLSSKPTDGYLLNFRNHFLGHPVEHGGEYYSMLRLFRRSKVYVDNSSVHSQFHLVTGNPLSLREKLDHYSYRSLMQVYRKFTSYAIREAHKKIENGEKTGLKKITMYPAHMFWARFIEDKGYKDGLVRLPLDIGFAYMEFLTYFLMFFIKK
jgi:glycosyltransferase involved in cell wall biosynthesis